jgi:hypothetical protein
MVERMGNESTYVKVEYVDKVTYLSHKLQLNEHEVRQRCLELGVDVMLALLVVKT